LFISLSSNVFSDFGQNTQLIDLFKENNLRLIVMCNFQGTNNVLDIVTSSRSPGYELTNIGLAKLQDAVASLQTENINHIYAAPAYRTQQSANLLGKAFLLHVDQLSIDGRLGMQNFGSAEGEDFDVYKQNFTSMQNMLESTPPNGEPGISVFNRTQDFLASLQNLENQTVLIITHAFNYCHFSKCITGKYNQLPAPGQWIVYDFANQE